MPYVDFSTSTTLTGPLGTSLATFLLSTTCHSFPHTHMCQHLNGKSTKITIYHHLIVHFPFNNFQTFKLLNFRFGHQVKVIHYLGSVKPWFCSFNASTGQLNHYSGNAYAQEFIKKWWTTYLSLVHPKIESVSLQVVFPCVAVSKLSPFLLAVESRWLPV